MILIMGLPGAGKSVQSQLIQDRLGLQWLSTGELFRKTDDVDIRATMERGELISDEQTSRMVGDHLKTIGYDQTFLLDGFPRTVSQAKWLLEHADEINKHIRCVLFLTVDEEVAARRLSDRGRGDDSEAARIKRNQEAQKVQPTLEYLRNAGVEIVEIDANGTVDEIFANISEAIGERVPDVHES